jgi:protein required for attachment to host cells
MERIAMKNTWIVVLNRESMRIFVQDESLHLTHLKTLKNETTAYAKRDVSHHRPGPTSVGGGTPRELAAAQFAREMARYLDGARKKNEVSEFIIVSEVKLAGLLKRHFSRSDSQMTTQWIMKDLGRGSVSEIEAVVNRERKAKTGEPAGSLT